MFKDRLKAQRKEWGWTQSVAAKKIGITVGMLNSYEQGYAEPGLKVLKRICDAYCVVELRKFLFS